MCTRKSCWQSALWADTSLLCWYLEPGKLCDHVSTEPASAGEPCWAWVCYFRLSTLLPSSPAFSSAERDSPGSFRVHRAATRASSHQQVSFFFQALYMMTYFQLTKLEKNQKHALTPCSCLEETRNASPYTFRIKNWVNPTAADTNLFICSCCSHISEL